MRTKVRPVQGSMFPDIAPDKPIGHHTGSGPGGHNIYDPVRARRHHSYLIVFAKGAA